MGEIRNYIVGNFSLITGKSWSINLDNWSIVYSTILKLYLFYCEVQPIKIVFLMYFENATNIYYPLSLYE